MSGKRVLDAIALLRVSRNVAAKHFGIRFSQVELYSKTSSLVKLIQSRTTPGFAAPSQSFSQATNLAAHNKDHIPTDASVPASEPGSTDEGIKQDHHYDRSQQHATQDPVPEDDINITQAEASRRPLPDGTIPPENSPLGQETGDPESYNKIPTAETGQHPVQGEEQGSLSPKASGESSIPDPAGSPLGSEEAKKLQRQYEGQIPAAPAKPPTGETDEFHIPQESDVFYQPEGQTEPVLSALPRVKVPKVENDVQAGDSHIKEDINADVYYAGANKESEPDEEALSQLFHSPKVSRLLKKSVGSGKGRQFHTYARLGQQSKSDQEEMKRLAADMAKDLQSGNVSQRIQKLVITTDQN